MWYVLDNKLACNKNSTINSDFKSIKKKRGIDFGWTNYRVRLTHYRKNTICITRKFIKW